MNIYVSNLKFTMTEDELKDIFSEFGEVESVKIITFRETGRSKGYGFVEMEDAAATKAIETLNGKEIQGRELKVNVAHEKKDR
jgi:RNA recognition motif-containing protein